MLWARVWNKEATVGAMATFVLAANGTTYSTLSCHTRVGELDDELVNSERRARTDGASFYKDEH